MKWLLNLCLPSPEAMLQRRLRESQLDLLHAEEQLEYWKFAAPMLRGRVQRLSDAVKASLPSAEGEPRP